MSYLPIYIQIQENNGLHCERWAFLFTGKESQQFILRKLVLKWKEDFKFSLLGAQRKCTIQIANFIALQNEDDEEWHSSY